YQFAIINNEGMVMYHSDAMRNMQENILTETENNTVLRSMLFSRESGCFQSLYHGKMHSFYIKPISQLPLNILVFNDNRQQSDVVLYAFCFTFFMLAILLGINMLEVLLIGALVTQSTKLKRNYQVFDTLFPNANHIKLYNLFCKYFLLAIALCIVSFVFDSFINSVFMLFMSINLCSILIQKSYMDLQPDEWQFKGRLKRLWLLAVIAIVYNVIAFITSMHVWLLWLLQVILFTAGIWLLNVTRAPSVANPRQQKFLHYLNILWPFNYIQSYSTMIMLRLILIGVLPVIFFYINAYNNEMRINTRMDQVSIIKELEQKNIRSISNNKQVNPDNTYSYLDSLTNIKWINASTTKQKTEPCNVNEKFFALFRLQLNNNRLYNLAFCQTEDGNSNLFFRNQGLTQIATQNTRSNDVIQVSTANIGFFKCPGAITTILIFCTAALMLIALYALLKVGVRKLFSLNQTDVLRFSQLNLDTICDKKNRLIFVNGSPGSNKFSTIHTALLGKACYNASEIGVINFIKIPDSDNDRLANYEWNNQIQKIKSGNTKLVILTHFEYANADERINRIKLNLLEDLLVNIDKDNERFRIIIISTVHQIAFLDFIQKDFATTVFNNDMKRWSILLGQFVNVFLPLKENCMAIHVDDMMQKDNRCVTNADTNQKQLLSLMADECRYTSFLDNQKVELANHILHTKSVRDPEELILYIQNAAYLYYRQLWDTLTFEEKFIVLDMAEDGLANTTDSHHVNVLLCKRILLFKNGRLTLFNTSFRNFILTAIEKDEIQAL
ncbi:MAG TPA: hypothetical protein PLO59_04475, partial [Bacteroidia bacterium]|nr:hypothetical protein [Bacteroidia bacterium]